MTAALAGVDRQKLAGFTQQWNELSPRQRKLILLRSSAAYWSEQVFGLQNAPFHEEWYRLQARATRLAVIAPREHGKSECFSVNATAHRVIFQPGIWTYVFAATMDQAAAIKERIDLAVREFRPDLVRGARQLSARQTVYANTSRVTVAGAGKAVRGAHPDVIICDDVMEESRALTDYQRQKTKTWFFGSVSGMAHPGTSRSLGNGRRAKFPGTRIHLVGTPFHRSDLLMGMRDNPLYTFLRYSAEPERLVSGTFAVEASNIENVLRVA